MVKYCPRCGYPNPDDALFCIKCGYQFPQQPSQPPNIPNYPPPKSHKMTIIGGITAVVILLIVFVVVLPLLPTHEVILPSPSTHASALYSPSQASSNFGGSWTLCKNKTGVICHTGSQYCIKYCNGTTIKKCYPSLFGTTIKKSYSSIFGNSFSSNTLIQCFFTSACFEDLKSSNNGQPVSLEILILHYDNNSMPSAAFHKLKSYINLTGPYTNASLLCPTYNGFNIIYIGLGMNFPTSSNVEEAETILIACGNNELIFITLMGKYASLSQMENVLSAIT